MSAGAVIVAAGMSSRMNDFKPMLNIGSISIAQRTVANFRQAGVKDIVVITGYNAYALEKHLAGNGIVFLRNENYETTHMFDSARIGLEYLSGKVDRIMFTPVDIPLFTSATVTALLESDAEIAVPVCSGEVGHPIMISGSLVKKICSYSGEQGLKGAMDSCGIPVQKIEVKDAGILHDADTPEDYRKLLEYHNSQLIRPMVSVALARELPFFDEKMALLLEQIGETGSVREACSRMQISYSSGWGIIKKLESQLPRPIIDRNQGGPTGSRSSLTEYGRQLLAAYNTYAAELRMSALELYSKNFRDLLD